MKQALRYNNKVVKKIYQADELVKKMNYGQSSDVFQYIKNDGDTPTPPAPVPYEEQYLTIETLTAGDLSLANAGSNVFNYSLDNGSTWNNLATGQTIAVEANKKVLFKGQELTASSSDGIGTINYTGNFNVYGNAMSLVFGDNFIGQEVMSDYQFIKLFNGNSTLLSAENLILPVTTLAQYCYSYMFYNCTSLTTAPELPATTLASSCYVSMFRNCTSLTTAPELPATTLASSCYASMFQGCTNLNYIKCLANDISARRCTYHWVYNVPEGGTFVKNAAMTSWTTGSNGIPEGWTVVNA